MVSGAGWGNASEVKGITEPQKDVFLSFTVSGKVDFLSAHEGDFIRKGEVIATLENLPEQIHLTQLKMQAANTAEIEASELELRQKEFDLSRMSKAHLEGAASDSELDNARLAVKIAQLRYKLTKHENEVTKLRYEELAAELERRKLISPVDGVVEIMEIDSGETVEALRPVVRVVVLDQLWVDLMVPLKLLPEIKKMAAIPVKFPTYGGAVKPDVAPGHIVYIAALADAASETVKIRIGVENPRKWPIGTTVTVELPDSAGSRDETPASKELTIDFGDELLQKLDKPDTK